MGKPAMGRAEIITLQQRLAGLWSPTEINRPPGGSESKLLFAAASSTFGPPGSSRPALGIDRYVVGPETTTDLPRVRALQPPPGGFFFETPMLAITTIKLV